jgi:hypothetical protein
MGLRVDALHRVPVRLRQTPRRLLAALRYQSDAPICVYQMGKVGSTAVHRAIAAQALPVPLYHAHMLAELDAIEASVRQNYAAPSSTLRQLAHGRELAEMIRRDPTVRWNVITIVREPVVRNVSAFFESLQEFVPGARTVGTSAADLREIFLERFGHTAPIYWLQRQLTPVFGIDPYTTPFPHSAGYQIIEGERARLLILRYEDLRGCFSQALQEFLGINVRRLPQANDSGAKWYHQLQRDFLDDFAFPASYLELMYESDYAQHFYTDDERRRCYERFTRAS